MLNFIINKIIRKNIYFYIFTLKIYKNNPIFFSFLEKSKYIFLKNSNFKYVIDIGSNQFQTAKLIQKINNNLTIYAFDPSGKDIKKKNIFFKKFALGNYEEKKILNMPFFKSINLNSLNSMSPNNLKNYLNKYLKNIDIKIKKKSVDVRKLDSFNLKSNFIKIDTEGFEFEILKGSVKHLKKNYPIILIEKNKDFTKIKKFLKKLDYTSYKTFKNKFVIDSENINDDIYFLRNKTKFHSDLIVNQNEF